MSDDVVDVVTANVYGINFRSAESKMDSITKSILQQKGKGFDSEEACAKWAHEHLLDIVVLGRGSRQFYYLTNRGDILVKRSWMDAFCSDLLFYRVVESSTGKVMTVKWSPKGIEYHNDARVNGEREEYGRQPIYHRDYNSPPGYYDYARGTFNIAKPFPVFARQTGRDTSHIYKYISAIAGECSLYLLAWLRMKMVNPSQKTQVVPIIVSRAQGTGKTTFAEVICKGLFGKDNVLVTDQYDSNARFNADYADALIVCHEEKEYEDKRNSAAALKSRATATTIRKENKGMDPVYQESYTDFIVTSNKDVPIKFDDDTDQRRFMIMEADENFTRKKNPLADEVFTLLYGEDINSIKKGIPFVEDAELIAQFKHELYTNEDIKKTEVRKFPHTPAYERCFTLPRTTEATEIEAIVRSLAPFIKASLENKMVIDNVTIGQGTDREENVTLAMYLQTVQALQYFPAALNQPEFVALCRPLIFYDQQTSKPFNHATVERTLYDCDSWLIKEYGIRVHPITSAVPGGFYGIQGRYRSAPTARFILVNSITKRPEFELANMSQPIDIIISRIGERLRVNGKWKPDPDGEFETVNEMKPGVNDLTDKNKNVQYMDTFLFEADETDKHTYMHEQDKINKEKSIYGSMAMLSAEKLFHERLKLQLSEAERLFKAGIASRVVYSGGKSYHILVRVEDSPNTLEEYRWLHAHLCLELSNKVTFDQSTADPARLTRAPIMFKREFDYHGIKVIGQQKCMHTNWNALYLYNWRPIYNQWLNRPLSSIEQQTSKRMMPTKPEYMEAMSALLHGTFWTDSQWNGRRQECFFPGYRLCRTLGYSHEQLWTEEGILDGLSRYYRKSEIEYWRTRQNSEIIRQIDQNVEEINNENN